MRIKHITLSLAILLSGHLSFAQEAKECCCVETSTCCEMKGGFDLSKDISYVVYDFATKNIKLPDGWRKLRKGDFISIKVLNYNPYLYKVSIEGKDSSIFALNDGKLLPWFLDPANLNGIVANLINKVGPVPAPAKAADNNNNTELTTVVVSSVKRLSTRSGNKSNKHPNTNSIQVNTDSIQVVKIQADQFKLINQSKKEVNDQKRDIDKMLYDYTKALSVLRKLSPDCDAFRKLMDDEKKTAIENTFDKLRNDNIQKLIAAQQAFDQYQLAMAPYATVTAKTPNLKAADDLVRQFYREFALFSDKIDSALSYKSVSGLITRLESVALLRPCYVSFPIQMAEDMRKISIDFRPRFDTLALPAYTSTLLLPLIQRRVWGVSSGINISGLRNQGFVNKTIPSVRTGADSAYVLTRDNAGDVQLGINALAYIGWKVKDTDKPDYWGLCFGAGMSIESKPKPRVLLGGSFITGEKNRIVISTGIIAGFVSQLSNAYTAGQSYTKPATDFLKDVVRSSAFISVNYSFLSK
jgi:hypothetical protein